MTRVNTYTEAANLSTEISEAELAAKLTADTNPVVYITRRRPVIAMDLVIFKTSGDYPFWVGYDYCDRKGYLRLDGTARLNFTAKVKNRTYNRPTVFGFGDSLDGYTYFHATPTGPFPNG